MNALFVNADDFGLRRGVNEWIIQGCEEGIIGSASLIANAPATEEAIVLARRHPELDLGVHLNLSQGWPVSPPGMVPSLLTSDGQFPRTLRDLLWRTVRGAVRVQEVQIEWEAQVARVVDGGVRPTHLDGHHHVHLLPQLIDVAIELARRFAVPAVRLAGHSSFAYRSRRPVQAMKGALIRHWSYKGYSSYREHAGSESFIELPPGLGRADAYRGILRDVAEKARPGVTELACHPGYTGPDPAAPESEGPDPELTALIDPTWRGELEARGIRLLPRRAAYSLEKAAP